MEETIQKISKRGKTKGTTYKQKRVVKDIAQNVGKPLKHVLLDAGYALNVANNPQIVTESQGFLREMSKYGLTKSLIANALSEDILSKKGNRVGELQLGAKILKMTSEDIQEDTTPSLNIVISEVLNVIESKDNIDTIDSIDI